MIVEEALEGEVADVLGRECYERGDGEKEGLPMRRSMSARTSRGSRSKHGWDAKLTDLLPALVAVCAKRGSVSIYDKCKAVFESVGDQCGSV